MNGTVETDSRLRMLYLKYLRGQRVAYRTMRPVVLAAGLIRYETTWVLRAA